MLDNVMNKGVLWHSFSDLSGCVFLHSISGETLSVKLSEPALSEILSLTDLADLSEEDKLVVESLINKGFIELRTGQ